MKLELTPWGLLLAVLVLLAMAGIYYLYTLCRGYRCLPLTTTDCPGGEPHHLVYVDDKELGVLAKIAKHTGKPCHGIRSYPDETKWLGDKIYDLDVDDPNARNKAIVGMPMRTKRFLETHVNDPAYGLQDVGGLAAVNAMPPDERVHTFRTDAVKAMNPDARARKKARKDAGIAVHGFDQGFRVKGGMPGFKYNRHTVHGPQQGIEVDLSTVYV